MTPATVPTPERGSAPATAACRFRPSKPPWPSQMCAICGGWRDDHDATDPTVAATA